MTASTDRTAPLFFVTVLLACLGVITLILAAAMWRVCRKAESGPNLRALHAKPLNC